MRFAALLAALVPLQAAAEPELQQVGNPLVLHRPKIAFSPTPDFFFSCCVEKNAQKVLVLSRHGVRGPYGLGTEVPSAETLAQYVQNPNIKLPLRAVEWGTSETDDPTEIVSPKLTKHGYRLIQTMGEVRKQVWAGL